MERKKIVQSEFTKLREVENYTIEQLGKYYGQSNEAIRRIMKRWNLSTSIKGRKRSLDVDLVDDLNTTGETLNLRNTESVND